MQQLWHWLTTPSWHVQGSEQRLRARLLAALLLPLVLVSGLTATQNVGWEQDILLGTAIVFCGSYFFSRTRWYHQAAFATVVAASLAPFLITWAASIQALSIQEAGHLMWLGVALLVSCLCLPGKTTFVFFGLNLGGLLLLPVFTEWTYGMILESILQFCLLGFLLFVFLTFHKNDQQQLQEAQQTLERAEHSLALQERRMIQERQMFMGGPVVIFRWVAKENWPVEYVSPNVVQWGYRPEDLMQGEIPYASIMHPDDWHRVAREVLEHSQLGRASFEQEYRMLMANAEVRWFYDFTVVIRDDQGTITHYQGYALDITERKKAAEVLHENEARFRAIFQTAVDGIIMIDTKGTIVTFNPAAEKIFGYNQEEVIGENVKMLMPNPYHKNHDQYLKNYLTTGIRKIIGIGREVMGLRKDGTTFPLELAISTIQEEQQQRFVGIVRDITERKLAEKERNRLEADIRQMQKMEALGTLAGGIAHDFNNLLFAMLGYADLIREELPSGGLAHDNLKELIIAGKRAKELVRQILAFSRQREQTHHPMYIVPVVKEAARLMRATLPTTIEIVSKIDSRSSKILGNPTQIHQVVVNLCTNAGYAMQENGGILEVALSYVPAPEIPTEIERLDQADWVKLTIQDTGTGISPEIHSRIFDPFFTTKPVGEGTGMGLAVVHGILQDVGGVIKFRSQVGKGSTFDVWFPTVDQTEVTLQYSVSQPIQGHECILLVDDERSIVSMIQQLLESLGYRVVTATDGKQALDLFRADPDRFDLVLSDQTMPYMRGDQIAQEMLKIRPQLPIILTTGFSHAIDLERAQSLGVKELLLKPIDLQHLGETIRRWIDS